MVHVVDPVVVESGDGSRVDAGEVGFAALSAMFTQDGLDHPGRGVDPLLAAQRIIAIGQALLLAAVEAERSTCRLLDSQCGGSALDASVVGELAVALRLSTRSAQFLYGDARSMAAYPQVWRALLGGDLDMSKARIVVNALDIAAGLDAAAVVPPGVPAPTWIQDEVWRRGLPYAREHTSRQLTHYLHRLLVLHDPDLGRKRRKEAELGRGVWLSQQMDGMSQLHAVLATEKAQAIFDALTGHATRSNGDPGDDRTLVQRRADSLADRILGDGTDQAGADVAGVNPTVVVNVTVPVDSLAGVTETPALVNGIGPIPADVARRLAAGDARWRRILTDRVTGAVLDLGHRVHDPNTRLKEQVRLRDGTCRFPGCSVKASNCDLDHAVAFPDGPTSYDNLHALCRRHHTIKHTRGWQVEVLPHGRLEWTTPTGRVQVTTPDPYALVA